MIDLKNEGVYSRMKVWDFDRAEAGEVVGADFERNEVMVEFDDRTYCWRKASDVMDYGKLGKPKDEKPVMKVKFLHEGAHLPVYKHEGDAAFDFFLPEDVTIPPNSSLVNGFKVPLGIAVEIPRGYFLEIFPRSSTGLNTPLRVSNSVGVVDEGYRGELCLILDNLDCVGHRLHAGERIAQGILRPRVEAEIIAVSELADSERGKNGTGSTGK